MSNARPIIHDINNQLAIAMGMLRRLERSRLDENVHHDTATKIQSSLEKIVDLVKALRAEVIKSET